MMMFGAVWWTVSPGLTRRNAFQRSSLSITRCPGIFPPPATNLSIHLAKVYVNDEVWIEFWGKEHRGSGSVFVA
jgi:hypothetical protein